MAHGCVAGVRPGASSIPADGGDYASCAWVDGLTWSGAGASAAPAISGDPGATVTGDATSGYVITPSAGNTAVDVTIPSSVDAAKVTVEVGIGVATVRPNGANVKVVKNGFDITPWLDIPAAVGGVIAIGSADVRQSVADGAMDPAEGAAFAVAGDGPVLTTSATKPGLTYTLIEGATLKTMADGASKVGDGQPWTPPITVKGGPSGFYRIKVEK